MAFSNDGGGSGLWVDTNSLAVQVVRGRWFMVFASFLIMSAGAGATYMFRLYSSEIKHSLGYDQSTLNLLSLFKDLGANVGVLAGLINEVTPPQVVLSLGAVLNFFGWFMIWLAVTKKISTPPVRHMCLYVCIGANSQAFANTGALVTCVKNFPESRGIVLGLLMGFVGLGGAIITQIYHAVYGDDSKSLILLVGWLPAVISLVFCRTIWIRKALRKPNELKVLSNFLYISLGLAGFLLIIIVLEQQVHFSRVGFGVSAAVVLVLLLLLLGIVIKQEYSIWKGNKLQAMNGSSNGGDVGAQPLPSTSSNTYGGPATELGAQTLYSPIQQREADSCFQNVFRPPTWGDDYTILQALFSIDMFILFFSTICGVGGTLTAIDNLGQIGTSLGYPKKAISTIVSLVSIWVYVGSVFGGFASDILLTKYKFPRPVFLTLIHLFSCIGHILIAFDVPNGLYIASIIVGFSFGAQWPLLYAIISEIFGLKYYSTLYNFGAVANPIGGYILNVRVTGYLYDREAERQFVAAGVVRKAGEELYCNGVHCFQLAFIIITAVTVLGALVSVILVVRTREFYRKFKEAARAPEMKMESAGGGGGVVTVAA